MPDGDTNKYSLFRGGNSIECAVLNLAHAQANRIRNFALAKLVSDAGE